MEFEYCSQNRGYQVIEEKDYPYLIFSCIWFKIYRIPRGRYDEEYVVWNWRRLSAYRDNKLKERGFMTLLKKIHRHIKGSRRADN